MVPSNTPSHPKSFAGGATKVKCSTSTPTQHAPPHPRSGSSAPRRTSKVQRAKQLSRMQQASGNSAARRGPTLTANSQCRSAGP
eukprot:3731535-Pyramimonas_sp.AAC.1